MKNNIFIGILIALVIGLSCYIGYDKVILEKEAKTVENTNDMEKEIPQPDSTWKDIDINDDRIKGIYNAIKDFSYKASRGAGINDFTNYELLSLGVVNGDFKKEDLTNEKKDPSSGIISATLKLDGVYNGLEKVFNQTKKLNFSTIDGFYSSPKVNTSLSNNSYSKIMSPCGFTFNQYNKESNSIDISIVGVCDSVTGPAPEMEETKIVSVQEKNDIIILKEKAIYISPLGGTDTEAYYQVYYDPLKTRYLDAMNFNLDTISNEKISVEKYLDKATTITYTFKKNNDTNKYYFVSSTIE